MNEKQRGIIIGSLIIFIGILILLSNLDVIYFSSDLTIGGSFLLVGITFISFFLNETHKLYLLFLGEVTGSIGLALVLGSLPVIPFFYREELTWIAILWGAGVVFFTVYFTNHSQIWSIIPGGIIFTIGLLVLVATFAPITDENLWVLFLVGLSITFGVLFLLSPNKSQSTWAKYLAIILMGLALLIFYLVNDDSLIIRIIFPIVLILIGSYYVYQGLQHPKIKPDETPETPAETTE